LRPSFRWPRSLRQSLRGTGLLATWCGLRRGEVIALRREDIDLDAGTVTVRRARVELLESPGAAFDADPKTDAGKRTVAVPPHVLPVLRAHMSEWAGPDLVFVRRDGQPMRGDAIRQAFTRARNKVGMPGFRFHDLGIRARPWPPRRARPPRISCGGSAMRRWSRRTATFTLLTGAMPRSRPRCLNSLSMATLHGCQSPSRSSTDAARRQHASRLHGR
jgi:hypothetical protein